MEAYREAARARYLADKKKKEQGASKNATSKAGVGDTLTNQELAADAKTIATSGEKLATKSGGEPSGFDSSLGGGQHVFFRLLGEVETISMSCTPQMSMTELIEAVSKRMRSYPNRFPDFDTSAPVVFKGIRVWPLEHIGPVHCSKHLNRACMKSPMQHGRNSFLCECRRHIYLHHRQLDVSNINLHLYALSITRAAQKSPDECGLKASTNKPKEAWRKEGEIEEEREKAGVDDLKTRLMGELLSVQRYLQNQLKPTIESLGIEADGILIGQTKEHNLAISEDDSIFSLLEDEKSTQLLKKLVEPFRTLYGLRKRNRISAHTEIYDLDRSIEFACAIMAPRIFKIVSKYFLFRRYVYYSMIEVATKAQEAYAVLQRANKMSPFDWMTEDAIKEEIREVGSALAKSIREGLHKRVGEGMMRWCRTAKHFDPLVFRHVFGFDYPPDPAVVPKLFPIPFFREYVSVMRSFGLEDTELSAALMVSPRDALKTTTLASLTHERWFLMLGLIVLFVNQDQDLEIPTMGADNKQTLTHFQLTL
eukprot:jgi/Bigna1/82215/fgenesh1_pg.89_\